MYRSTTGIHQWWRPAFNNLAAPAKGLHFYAVLVTSSSLESEAKISPSNDVRSEPGKFDRWKYFKDISSRSDRLEYPFYKLAESVCFRIYRIFLHSIWDISRTEFGREYYSAYKVLLRLAAFASYPSFNYSTLSCTDCSDSLQHSLQPSLFLMTFSTHVNSILAFYSLQNLFSPSLALDIICLHISTVQRLSSKCMWNTSHPFSSKACVISASQQLYCTPGTAKYSWLNLPMAQHQ